MASRATISLNRGMNTDNGAFYCQNIAPARDDGVLAGLSMTELAKASTSATSSAYYLRMPAGFTQIGDNNNACDIAIFGKDQTYGIHLFGYYGAHTCLAYHYGSGDNASSWSRGITVDPTGNLVWAGGRYLGKAFKTTLSGALSATATACSLTSTVNVGAAGYLLVKDNNTTSSEVIQYTAKSATGVTTVTHGKYNSIARAHDNGTAVYYFKENWKDLGVFEPYNYRPVKNWEDKVLIGNGQYVATYSGDGSDFDASALHLPSGYKIIDFGFVPTGSSSKILVCANKDEIGTIFVWDGSDTTWMTTIDMENISRADGTIIATDIGIYECNGVSNSLIWRVPDSGNSIIGNQVTFYDIKEKGQFILASIGNTSKLRGFKGGLWIIDKRTGDSYMVTPPSGGGYGELIYSMFSSGENYFLLGSSYSNGAVYALSNYPPATNSLYWTLFKPSNARNVRIKQVRLNIGIDPTSYGTGEDHPLDFDVVLRCYDFTKQLFQYTQLKSGTTDTATNTMVIVNTLGVPSVGDRIEIVAKEHATSASVAGYPRNITAVTAGTGIYTLTLDEALPTAITTATYNTSAMTTITPLKKIGKKSITTTIDLDDLTFQLADQPKGKKFLFEIEVRCTNPYIAPELNSLEIEYDVI